MMQLPKSIGKREFMQHTSKYIQWVEEHDISLIITHHKRPELVLSRVKPMRFQDLAGTVEIKVQGDVNESVLPGYDEWLS